ANLQEHQPTSVEDVRLAPQIVAFSADMRRQATDMKRFLMANLYRHYRVQRMTNKARIIVRDLFVAFMQEPGLLASEWRRDDANEQARAIADYIAGMTDRYAIAEHNNLFRM